MTAQRLPLDAAAVRRELGSTRWRAFEVVAETGSTNADLAEAARAGAAEGVVRVAEHQYAGRGRAGRAWSSPPRAGLALSILLRPATVPAARWGWLPLLAGVATAAAIADETGLVARLKWPNDVLLDGGKCAGILAEVVDGAVVLGVGINVHLRADELPPVLPGAAPPTSLALAGAREPSREALLLALLRELESWYGSWLASRGDADGSGLRPAYLAASATVGRPVRAHLPDGSQLTADAVTVDAEGCLVVVTGAGTRRALAAGDITHLRT